MAKLTMAHLVLSVLDTVVEMAPNGTPEGPMYLAFQAHGISLDAFQQVIGWLTAAGMVRKQGNVLYSTPKGAELQKKMMEEEA